MARIERYVKTLPWMFFLSVETRNVYMFLVILVRLVHYIKQALEDDFLKDVKVLSEQFEDMLSGKISMDTVRVFNINNRTIAEIFNRVVADAVNSKGNGDN